MKDQSTRTTPETILGRAKAMQWWEALSSPEKTKLCNLHTEHLGIRRWETLTGREIEEIYNAPHGRMTDKMGGAESITRKQAGEKIFQAIKADLEKRGYNLARLAPEYIIGKSTIYAFRKGIWTEDALASLPFAVTYEICNLQIGESSGEIEPNPPKSGRPRKV